MTPDQIRQQHEVFPALAEHLKKLNLLGADGQPVRELVFHAHAVAPGRRAAEVELGPLDGADPERVEEALRLARAWDWGPPRPPKVTLGRAVKRPEDGGDA